MVAGAAVRWERAHGETPPKALLTRDLRSTTAQLRMVGGHAWHIADALLAAPAAELDAGQRLDLQVLRSALRAVDAGAMRVAQSWQRRLSDLNGRSEAPGEVAFVDLKSVLDRVVRGHDGLHSPDKLVTSRLVAARLLDALDELVWSAEQVARGQQSAVAGLIREGRMFVPRRDVARLELAYLRRPGGGSRPLQAWWVRTNLANCFDDLTNALAWSADHLTHAADVARRLAGTSRMSRRSAEQQPRMPAPYLDLPGIGDPGQEMSVLDR
jgi:hypothetical protein